MIRRFAISSLALFTLVVAATPSPAGWGVGISVGFPIHCRPHCYHPRYCYHPYPLYVPAPVYVQPVTVIEPVPVAVQAVPLAPAPAKSPAPAPAASIARASYGSEKTADIERYTRQLQHPDQRERAEAAVQLGRLRSTGSLTALSAALSNDRSPMVREAAARGLGLLGSTDALDPLQRAAQGDEDRDVRKSAAYAADVIRANLSRR